MEYSPQYDYQPRRKSVPEVLIENILISIVAVFIIVLGFLMVAMSMSTIDNSSDYKTYSQTFTATGSFPELIYTSSPMLTSITLQYYDGAWHTVLAAGYTFDDTYGTITVPGPYVGATTWQVDGTLDYATPPYETFFSVLGIGLVIGAIATIFGIIGYAYYKNG
jgi:hypothetical protein